MMQGAGRQQCDQLANGKPMYSDHNCGADGNDGCKPARPSEKLLDFGILSLWEPKTNLIF